MSYQFIPVAVRSTLLTVYKQTSLSAKNTVLSGVLNKTWLRDSIMLQHFVFQQKQYLFFDQSLDDIDIPFVLSNLPLRENACGLSGEYFILPDVYCAKHVLVIVIE